MIEDQIALARQTLEEICKDKRAPAIARARAARTLLEISGHLRNPRAPARKAEAVEMSLDELDARLAELDERPAVVAGRQVS